MPERQLVDARLSGPFVLAVDLDGVIHKYSKGWHDGTIYDIPMEGTKDCLKKLKLMEVKIIIHSARACSKWVKIDGQLKFQHGQVEAIGLWLRKYEIPFDEVWTGVGKPIADIYLDDRGMRFSNWGTDFTTLQLFIESWQKKRNEQQEASNAQFCS